MQFNQWYAVEKAFSVAIQAVKLKFTGQEKIFTGSFHVHSHTNSLNAARHKIEIFEPVKCTKF